MQRTPDNFSLILVAQWCRLCQEQEVAPPRGTISDSNSCAKIGLRKWIYSTNVRKHYLREIFPKREKMTTYLWWVVYVCCTPLRALVKVPGGAEFTRKLECDWWTGLHSVGVATDERLLTDAKVNGHRWYYIVRKGRTVIVYFFLIVNVLFFVTLRLLCRGRNVIISIKTKIKMLYVLNTTALSSNFFNLKPNKKKTCLQLFTSTHLCYLSSAIPVVVLESLSDFWVLTEQRFVNPAQLAYFVWTIYCPCAGAH